MKNKIKILIAEHDENDLEILEHELIQGGFNYESKIVKTEADFSEALEQFVPDIILSDYTFPSFDGPTAFKIRERLAHDTPFIFVSGTIGEEAVVELIKNGVTDFTLKDKLFTLPNKINRALKDIEKIKKHREAEELVISNEKKFRHTLDNMLEGIQIHDFDFRYTYVNDVLVKSSTYSREELIGYTLMEKYPGIEQTDVFKAIKRCLDQRMPERLETKFTFPNGTIVDFELSIEPIPEGVSILSIDRTEQNLAKQKLLKVNRLYAFLSAINQSIVHINNEQELLNNACKIAVDIGQFKMSWIDLIDESTGKLNIVSLCGTNGAITEAKKVSGMNYKNPVLSGTPTGRALITGELAISNDLQNDPSMDPWKKEITENGIKAGMVLPIKKFGKVVGVFGFYSALENFFDDEEIELLKEATADISFALENFEKEKQHWNAQELFLKKEKRFRALIEKSSDMKMLADKDGNILYASPAVEKVLGCTLEEILQKKAASFIHPEDSIVYLEKRKKLLEVPGSSFHIEIRFLHKDGHWTWCEGIITNLLNDPSINALVSNFRDISERKEMDKKRIFDENNLSALINNTKDLMWSVDRDYNLITSNTPFDEMGKAIFGKAILKGENVLSVSNSPEMLENFKQKYERAFAGEVFTEIERFEYPHEFWTEISYYPIRKGNEVIGTACFSRDITERKISESNLIKSEERLKEAQTVSHISNWEVDLITYINTWSDEFYNIFGIKREDITPSPEAFLSLLHPEDTGFVGNIMEETFKTFKEGSFNARTKDTGDGIRQIYTAWKFDLDKNNKPIRLYGILQDITERKRIEESLVRSESRLNEAQAIAHVGNWEVNFQTGEALWSEESCRIYGLPPTEKKQSYSTWASFIHPEDVASVMKISKESEKTLGDTVLNHRIILKDGSIKHIYAKSKFILNSAGKPTGLYGISQDVTENKLAEKEKEKMVSDIIQRSKNLEQFTYIISHNLRAPIANILGISNVLREKVSDADRARIQQFLFVAVDKLDDTVKDLNKILQIRSEITENKEPVNLPDLVNVIKSSILNLVHKEHAQIITDFSAIDTVTTLKSYAHSVFYNLISNAIKYRQTGKNPIIKIRSYIEADKVMISFKDNGTGIDLELQGDKVFGLYKRFHENIEGKGLGLFMTKTQMEVLGGHISIKSEIGVGTEFILEFPK